jgi:hypothetical protein
MAQAIAYQLSFIDGGVSSGLVGIAARLWSVTEIANAAQASISALVAPLQNIANAWSGREQQLNNISRSLRQYQFVGQSVVDINKEINRTMPGASAEAKNFRFSQIYGRQFEDARQFSRGIVRQMSRDAAILPGELNDYMQTFSTALPQLAKVQGMTLQRATHLTNYLTAGAVAAGIDAPQASRDIMQALTGRSSIVDRSWTEVFSNYARFKGKRINTPAEFNRLTQEQRVQVLEDIAGQLQPMMDATGDAYEAIMGTFTSLQHELYLEASEPLFNAWKRTMIEVNRQLSAFYPVIAGIGRYFAQLGAGAIDKVTDTIMRAEKFMLGILPELQNFGARISNFVTGELFPVLMRIYGPLRSAFGVAGNLFIGAVRLIWSGITDYVWPAFKFLVDKVIAIGTFFWGVATTAYGVIGSVFSAMGTVFNKMFPFFESFFSMLWQQGGMVFSIISFYVSNLLVPTLTMLSPLFSTFLQLIAIFQFVAPGIQAVIGYFQELMAGTSALAQVLQTVAGVIGSVFNPLAGVGEGVSAAFDLAGRHMGEAARAQEGAVRQSTNAIPDWMLAIQKSISEIGKGGADLNRTGHGDRTNRPHAVQDFRYSRFDITQRFAEGFDPDRVASAFASDLEAMASQRLSSGFAPAFTSA